VSSAPHDDYSHQILTQIESGQFVSQRKFATNLGIALGLTNLLVRRLVRKGWIRAIQINPNRVAYFLTPTGIAEKARLSRRYFQNSVEFYARARNRLRQRFDDLAAQWVDERRTIVFFGTGEVAEIGYVCLQETNFELTGVIDDGSGRTKFFNLTVSAPEHLKGATLNGRPFGRVIVMSFTDQPHVHAALAEAGVPAEMVFWL